MARESTQLAVLGAGPGGYAAAFYAADLGMQVALVDMEKNPGGVCLYRGCIPSKALLHVAKVVDESRHASAWGVTFADPKIDVDKLRAFKQGVVDKLTGGVGQVGRLRKVKFIQGRAALTGPKSMTIATGGGETELQFEHCILATGSSPTRIPSFSLDSPRMMDSTSGLELPDIPKSLLVIGGGYIGLELGTVYATLGSMVSVVEMTGGLLPGADRDLVAVLQKRLEKLFAKIMLDTKVVKVAEERNAIPHVSQFDKADVTELEALRKRHKEQVAKAGGNLTVTAMLVRILATAVRKFPQFNASIDTERGEIVFKKYLNIGVAVDTDRGLLVPVIRSADEKNITQIAVELNQLAERARDRKLTPDDMSGGSITISNLGGIGGTYFTPIVNWPEVAILGVSRGAIEPVWKDGKFEPVQRLPLSLSYDHRVIDGADAMRFLRWVVEAIEQPFLLSLVG
jgi:thioredoxin reductase